MGADKILSIIMKKLKDYRTNPKKSTPQDKAKQENLKKLLHVYSSLRKKEQSKMKLNEQKMLKNDILCNNTEISQKSSHGLKNIVHIEDDQNSSNQFDTMKSNKKFDVVLVDGSDTSMDVLNIYNEDISSTENIQSYVYTADTSMSKEGCSNLNVIVEGETNLPNTECDIQYNDGTNILSNIIELKNELEVHYDDIKFETEIINPDQTHIEKDTRKVITSSDNEQITTISGFLMRLGEGLKRLPYKQRAKLEIEYLRRLYEVQDDLGIFDN